MLECAALAAAVLVPPQAVLLPQEHTSVPGSLRALLSQSPLSSRYGNLLIDSPVLLGAALQWAREVSLWPPMRDFSDTQLWELLIRANNESNPTTPPWGAVDKCTLRPKCCAVYLCDMWTEVGLYEKLYDDAGMVSAIVSLAHDNGMFFNHHRGVEWFGGWAPTPLHWASYESCSSRNQTCHYAEEQPHATTACASCGRVWVELRGPGFMLTLIETYSISSAGVIVTDGGSFYGERYVLDPTQLRRLNRCALNSSVAATMSTEATSVLLMNGVAADPGNVAVAPTIPPLVDIGVDCSPRNRLPFVPRENDARPALEGRSHHPRS